MAELNSELNGGELTAAQRRAVVQVTWAIWLLITGEIAAVVVLAGLGPWIAVAVLLAYAEINRRWRPLARVSTPVFLVIMLAHLVLLTAATIVLAIA